MAAKRRHEGPFRAQLAQLQPQLNLALFERARRASRMAKHLTGAQRHRAYQIKHHALGELIRRGGATTELDWYNRPGLVSVALDHGRRLHTRSAWLREAEGARR